MNTELKRHSQSVFINQYELPKGQTCRKATSAVLQIEKLEEKDTLTFSAQPIVRAFL